MAKTPKGKGQEGVINRLINEFNRLDNPVIDPELVNRKYSNRTAKVLEPFYAPNIANDVRVTDKPEIKLSDLEGRGVLFPESDVTAAGYDLVGIGNKPLARPVRMETGVDHIYNSPDADLWKSDASVVNKFIKRAQARQEDVRKLQKDTGGQDVFILPYEGGPQSSDWWTGIGRTMINYNLENAPEKTVSLMDEFIRSKIPDWPGADSPDAEKVWNSTNGGIRMDVTNTLDQMRLEGGLTEGQARVATSRQDRLNIPHGSLTNVGLLDIARKSEPNLSPDYNASLFGEGVGEFKTPITAYDLLSERRTGTGKPLAPRSLQWQDTSKVITEQDLLNAEARGVKINSGLLPGIATAGVAGASILGSDESDASIAKLADRGMKLIDVVDPEDSRVGQYYLQKGDDTKSIGSVNTDYALDSGFGEGYMSSQNTEISPEYRRQGIGREVYDAIEELSGNQLVPSTHLSPQGAAMWNSRDRGLLEQVQDRMGKDNYDTVEDVLYPEGRPDPNAVKLRGFDRAYELGGIGLGGGLLAADSGPNFAIEGRNIRAEEDARRDQLQQVLSRSQESPITDLAMKFVESAVMEPASYAAGIINPDFREPVRDSVNYDMGSTAQSMADKAGSNVGTAFEKYIMPTLINKIVPAVVDAYNKDSLLGGSAKDQVEYAQSLYGELPSEARRFTSREIKPRAQNLMGLIGSIL